MKTVKIMYLDEHLIRIPKEELFEDKDTPIEQRLTFVITPTIAHGATKGPSKDLVPLKRRDSIQRLLLILILNKSAESLILKKILIVAPHYGPTNQVGALRARDWLNRFTEMGWTCEVITSYPDEHDNRVIYIPIKTNLFLWSISALKIILKKNTRIIIFSGGPFEPFFITLILYFFKSFKTILDFRDPLAGNPKFNDNFGKKFLKKLFQKIFIITADRLITVNRQCALMMGFPNNSLIVPNGYDEKAVNQIRRENFTESFENNKIVHAGKWYTSPDILIEFLNNKSNITFIGQEISNTQNVTYLGSMNYADTLKIINQHGIGLILAQGSSFETLTKIYDYMGLGLKIWVITEIDEEETGIKDLLKNYPRSVISLNSKESINDGWRELNSMPNIKTPSRKYSRKEAFQVLYDSILSISE